MKTTKIFSRILDVLILLVFILFFSSAGFQDKKTSGWYVQTFPNLNGCTINSFDFLDSLTGFAVTNQNSSTQSYILRTTNGGDNWAIVSSTYPNFNKIQFADRNIGYASAYTNNLWKTTNGGDNWFLLSYGGLFYPESMALLNKDTLLFTENLGPFGGVFRTTDGGNTFQRIWAPVPSNIDGATAIYMYNKNLGFHIMDGSNGLRRTTNGGVNWIDVPNEHAAAIEMLDTLTGWKAYVGIKKTTDGGLTWNSQIVPQFNINDIKSISILNKDTIWAVGPHYDNGSNISYAIILITTNGGSIWSYQIADTSVMSGEYRYVKFYDRNYGWAWPHFYIGSLTFDKEIHTKVGGNDTTFLSGINPSLTESPDKYTLYQNYPNPFNPSTTIKYQCSIKGHIKISVFDITGKEVAVLVNEDKPAGIYSTMFDAGRLTSGIYFYRMIADDRQVDVKKMIYVR